MMSTATGTCPSLEEIAAFLDGRLEGEERTRVVAHLADCPSCYEVFAEAARSLLEEEEEEARAPDPPEAVAPPKPAEVVPFPRKRIWPWIGSIAAVLLVGVAIALLYPPPTMPEMVTSDLVTPKLASSIAGNYLWDKGVIRGPKVLPESTLAELMIGVHLVDLRLALTRNDAQPSLDALSSTLGLIDALYSSGTQKKLATSIQTRIYHGQQPRTFLEDAEKVEAGLAEVSSFALAFGEWTEAGRLSALAHRPEFFQDRDNRKFLRWLLRNKDNEDVALDPEVVQSLEQIEESLKSDSANLRYDDLRQRFEAILKHYQN